MSSGVIIKYLRHISDDVAPGDEEYNTSPECEGQGSEDCCPKHQDCGICRYEFMKNQGWLREGV